MGRQIREGGMRGRKTGPPVEKPSDTPDTKRWLKSPSSACITAGCRMRMPSKLSIAGLVVWRAVERSFGCSRGLLYITGTLEN